MEIVVPLVVGGLTGLSAAAACGAGPRASRVPPAELASHALESVVEKLPRELAENDLLKKIARSWARWFQHIALALLSRMTRRAWHACCCRVASAASP